jgi:diguanylate cyclase (GGDEF)-like protein
MSDTEHLSRVPLLSGLDEPDLQDLAAQTRPVTFPAGTTIVEIGDMGQSLFLIVEGSVRVLYPSRGNDFELARLGAGDFFGEMALLNDKPRSATVQAVDEVNLLVLDKLDFREVIRKAPAVALRLLETLSFRIRNADDHISSLSDKAMRDPLTGLLNRRAFNERIKEEIDRAVRYDDTFALILIDLDRFKGINDTFGHDVGDVVLSWIGRLLNEHTRSADTPFRIGGEEFAIIAPATPPATAQMVSQRLVDVVAEARPPVDFEMQVTMSCGYACCPIHSAAADLLYQIGDQALLRAKEGGRNRVCEPAVASAPI